MMQPRPITTSEKPGWLRYDPAAPTSPRLLLVLLGVALLLGIILIWSMSAGDDPVETAEAPVAPPIASPVAAPAPTLVAPPVAPSASSAQIVLHGVTGSPTDGAAIISVGEGQRLVRIGRDIVSGLPLIAIGADHIIVRENGQDVRIPLRDSVVAAPGG